MEGGDSVRGSPNLFLVAIDSEPRVVNNILDFCVRWTWCPILELSIVGLRELWTTFCIFYY